MARGGLVRAGCGWLASIVGGSVVLGLGGVLWWLGGIAYFYSGSLGGGLVRSRFKGAPWVDVVFRFVF